MLFGKHPARDGLDIETDALKLLHSEAARLFFEPKETVRCAGRPMFRTKSARDAGCLADVDPEVVRWSCLPFSIGNVGRLHVPDLALVAADGSIELLDVAEGGEVPPAWAADEATRLGLRYRVLASETLRGHRLDNARELLRYSGWRVPLDTRVRLVAALEDQGSLTVRDCMEVLGARDAIAVIAALTLRRFVHLDIDEAPIGPDTRVQPVIGT